jgi:hypothetical protein
MELGGLGDRRPHERGVAVALRGADPSILERGHLVLH